MSYILEALKKSEQERNRGSVPDIKSVHDYIPPPITAKRSWWPWVLLAVIGINVVILGVVYLGGNGTDARKTTTGSDEIASTNSNHSQASSNTNVAAPTMPSPSVPRNVQKPEPTHIAKVPQENHSKRTTPQQTLQETPHKTPRVIVSKVPLTRDNTVGNTAEQQRIEAERAKNAVKPGKVKKAVALLPADLPENIRKQIPNIAFEGHVYSSTVSRRSVMINGKKMRQGDAMSGGLVLKEITPFGAEFEYQGYVFKLNALQDWSYR